LSVKKRFETESALEKFSSSFLQNLTEFSELIVLQKQYQQKRKEVIAAIDRMLQFPEQDRIFTFFNELSNHAQRKESIFLTTDEIIQKAHRRKLAGNPPTSDSYSIGDEINWEIILANVKENMTISNTLDRFCGRSA
jgi:hypothetical protein